MVVRRVPRHVAIYDLSPPDAIHRAVDCYSLPRGALRAMNDAFIHVQLQGCLRRECNAGSRSAII